MLMKLIRSIIEAWKSEPFSHCDMYAEATPEERAALTEYWRTHPQRVGQFDV